MREYSGLAFLLGLFLFLCFASLGVFVFSDDYNGDNITSLKLAIKEQDDFISAELVGVADLQRKVAQAEDDLMRLGLETSVYTMLAEDEERVESLEREIAAARDEMAGREEVIEKLETELFAKSRQAARNMVLPRLTLRNGELLPRPIIREIGNDEVRFQLASGFRTVSSYQLPAGWRDRFLFRKNNNEEKRAIDRKESSLAEARRYRAELAEVESLIESERQRYYQALDVINTLTSNKTRAVRAGSTAHRRCQNASRIIDAVERRAPELKARRAKLESLLADLE